MSSTSSTHGDCLPTYTIATISDIQEGTLRDDLTSCEVAEHEGSRADEVLESSELSDGEGDVEVEHLGSGYDHSKLITLPTHTQAGNVQYSVGCRKRTLITIWQRAILEELYRGGMSSASVQLSPLHLTAAEKTGLEVDVIKNWIRNRRRPGSARTAEKIANFLATGNLPNINPNVSVPTIVPSVSTVSTMTAHVAPVNQQVTTMSQQVQQIPSLPVHSVDVSHHSVNLVPPESKRPRIEPSSTINPSVTLPPLYPSHAPHSSHAPHPLQAPHPSHVLHLSTSPPMASVPNFLQSLPLLVKVRISESGEEDFIEVEVPALTHQSLLMAVCEELELAPSDVAKIRKLPNVLVRKDKDVQRLREGQELEVILNQPVVSNVNTGDRRSSVQTDHTGVLLGDSVAGISTQSLPVGHFIAQQMNGAH